MYYESDAVQRVLTCTFCSRKFSHVARIIPECGNSICEDCHQDLRADVDSKNKSEYQCRACDQQHSMPTDGLAANKAIMVMLELKPEEKAMSYEAMRLKKKIREVQDELDKLESIDECEEIHSFCDMIVGQINEAIESGIRHLNRIGDKIQGQVNDYRSQLLNSKITPDGGRFFELGKEPKSTPESELRALKPDFVQFNAKWNEFFSSMNKVVRDQDVESAVQQIESIAQQVHEIEAKARDEILQEQSLEIQRQLLVWPNRRTSWIHRL